MDYNQMNHLENQHEFDWLYQEEPFLSNCVHSSYSPPLTESFGYSSSTSSFEHDPFLSSSIGLIPFPYQNKNLPSLEFEFNQFDDSNGDFGFWDDDIDPYNAVSIDFTTNPVAINENIVSSSSKIKDQKLSSVKSKSINSLDLDEIRRHFDVPITKAAKEMKVGLTVLKKRCRELNIMRWPHRKIKSLRSLINNVKELGLTREIERLEEHKRLIEKLPEMELTEETKKLRQACFKANYKKKRSLLAFH